MEIRRLHLASLRGPDGLEWPVHGFVIMHPAGPVSVITTPGHTAGHQCVVVSGSGGSPDLLIGDAAYTPRQYYGPADAELPSGQASDLESWRASVRRIRAVPAARVHFCHHTSLVHNRPAGRAEQ